MARRLQLTLVLVAGLLTTGCLEKGTTHTLYLSPDGSLRWTVEESGVHSDDPDEGRRAVEEQAYIGPALIGAHRMAIGLQALAPDGVVQTTVIRDIRPFHVITEATFFRADRALERLFKEAGLEAAAALDVDAGRHRLTIRLDFSQADHERDSPAAALLEDFENFRFVLTDGRFVAGGGFDVPDRQYAVLSREWLDAAGKAYENRGRIDLVLTWLVGE
jgi:hypothetical protein